MVWGEGEDQQFAAFKLKPGISPDTVEIDWLMAGPEQRKGIGSRAIQELQRRATEAGVKLSLYPWGKGRISQSSLSKLYKRHGFKPLAKGAKQMTWAPEQEETVTEARIPYEIEEFLDSLSPDDVGVEEFGPYRVHFEGFTDDCQSSADYRKNPEAVYQQVFADFIQREGGRKPIEQNFTGDEDYPILYSIFKIPRLVKEVTTVPTVAKSKRAHLDVMPNDGRPIPKGEEADYLGDKIGRLGGSEVWQYNQGPMRTFCVFDPVTRISQLAVTGSSFPDNPDSLIIKGVYSGPENATRAANLYAWLVARHGLTLVSDIKQSEGGYRVWRELERRFGRHMNIYAFNTKTDEPLNLTTLDEPDTHVSQEHLPGATRDVKDIAKNVRLVASPK
jgi:hypothetical protein